MVYSVFERSGAGSRQENASNQEHNVRFDSLGTEMALAFRFLRARRGVGRIHQVQELAEFSVVKRLR